MVLMTREWHRQVGVGKIGVSMVTVMTGNNNPDKGGKSHPSFLQRRTGLLEVT